ncbi:MAG: major capsid protein [Sporomusaceae bacterium]|nr:major capsid protein [Sporomusaceae bacterium]
MALNLNQTQTLLGALERSFPPQTLFRDTFFPTPLTFPTKTVLMDYRKGNRQLAPFVAQGGSGANVNRIGFVTKEYEPPMTAPERPLTVKDLEGRAFGENVFSTQTPEQRAALIVAQDMADLVAMNTRRMEWMCAQLMVYGSFTVTGTTDDGKAQLIDTVTYSDWTQKLTLSGADLWSASTSDAYSHLEQASQTVSRNSGMVPGVAIMSYKTKAAFLNNASIVSKLMIPSRDNMALMSLQPRITAPGVVRIGYIEGLNLELWAYDGIYQDDAGNIQQYLPDGYVIVGVPGRGSQLFGAVTQLESDDVYRTYQGANVPKVWSEQGKDTRMLRVASKGVPKPEFVDDWFTLKVL